MAANAATGDIVTGSPTGRTAQGVNTTIQTDEAVTASASPKYALAVEGANDGNVATAGYVKGAYNAAIKAINKVSDTASSALQASDIDQTYDATSTNAQSGVAVASAISATGANYATAAQGAKADTALQASDIDQTYDATSTNAQSGVAVASAISAAGVNYATAAQGAKADTALQSGNNISLLTNDAGYLISTDLSDYAKKTGVTQTITNSSISGTVPVLTT